MNWNQELYKALLDLAKYFITMSITGLIAWIFSKKYLRKVLFARKISQLGLKEIVYEKYIPEKSMRKMVSSAKSIKFLFMTGYNFFVDYQSVLKKAAESGTKLSLLIIDVEHEQCRDIVKMETDYGLRDSQGRDIKGKTTVYEEVETIKGIYSNVENVEIRHYSSGYRLPCVIAEYENGDIETWFSITLPPKRTTSPSSFYLCGKMNRNESAGGSMDNTFPEEVCRHFEALWSTSIHQ